MDKDAIIATLRAHREELERAGIAHAALFGSHARGEARADSDIDILIEFAPALSPSLFDYAGMRLQVADLFPGKVDVVEKGSLKPRIASHVISDAVYAF